MKQRVLLVSRQVGFDSLRSLNQQKGAPNIQISWGDGTAVAQATLQGRVNSRLIYTTGVNESFTTGR